MTLIFVDIPPKMSMKNSPPIDLHWGWIYWSPRKWQNLLNFLQGVIVELCRRKKLNSSFLKIEFPLTYLQKECFIMVFFWNFLFNSVRKLYPNDEQPSQNYLQASHNSSCMVDGQQNISRGDVKRHDDIIQSSGVLVRAHSIIPLHTQNDQFHWLSDVRHTWGGGGGRRWG